MKEDKFIGTTFPTPKGGILTVTGVSHVQKNKVKVYKVSCSICCEDMELYPEDFTSTKGNLERDKIPCGCHEAHQRGQREWYILAERYCQEHNLKFKGSDKFENNRSYFKYECTVCGYVGQLAYVKLRSSRGCKCCNKLLQNKASLKPTEQSVADFHKIDKLPDHYHYRQINRLQWEITCDVCKNDVFSKAGMCEGTFIEYGCNLLKGVVPCRCNPAWRIKSMNFIELAAQKVITGKILEYGDFKGNKTTIKWLCPEGHENTKMFFEILNLRKDYCSTCRSFNDFGLYTERLDETDNLYLLELIDSGVKYIKVGRTFNPTNRFKAYVNEGLSYEILGCKSSDHLDVYNTEQAFLLNHYSEKQIPLRKFTGWTECFNYEYKDYLIEEFNNVELGW